MNMIRHPHFSSAVALVLTACMAVSAAISFRSQHVPEVLFPSEDLARIRYLSDFNPLLAGTPGDTEVYVFGGDEPGGSLLVLGGTHANEIAGVLTAVLLVECLEVRTGRAFIIPHANASAATHTMPREAHPAFIEFDTPAGPRRFRYGARRTNPIHQGPDPVSYRHPASSTGLSGREARNLNRVHPGVRDGTLTERVAWAIVELIRREHIDMAVDLHEAPPERRLVNALVAAEPSLDIAAQATLELQAVGWDFHLESSSPAYHGYSHREWTDVTDARPFLMETANLAQGRMRRRTTSDLVVVGRDEHYLKMAQRGLLSIPYDAGGVAIEVRIARNLDAIAAILDAYNESAPETRIRLGGWPTSDQLRSGGLGVFLGRAGIVGDGHPGGEGVSE